MKIPTQKGEHSCKCRVVPLMKTGNLSKLMYNIWISTCVHSTMQLLPSQYLSRILQRTQCCNESLIVAMTKMYWNFLYRYGLEDKTIQVARLTRNVEVVGLRPIKAPRCFLQQETLPLLLSTGWFQEWIRAWLHNWTKINWGPYVRLA